MSQVVPRFHLLVKNSLEVLRRFPLKPGRHVLGRSRSADLRVNHRSLSREHIALHIGPEGVELEDLGSLNGSFINGQKMVDRTPWHTGDTVSVGDLQLQLVLQAKVEVEAPGGTYLVLLNTSGKGTVFERRSGRLVIGRSRSSDVRVDDSTVSRSHARIDYLSPSEGWMLEDLDSANGTYLEGTKVSQCVLRGGETFRVGDVEILFAGDSPHVSSRRMWLMALLMALLGGAIGVLVFNLFASL